MSKAFANPKLFAVATLLFAVATFVNLSMNDAQAVNPLMSSPGQVQSEELKAGVSPSRLTLVAAVR
jgi:hypothetical protein